MSAVPLPGARRVLPLAAAALALAALLGLPLLTLAPNRLVPGTPVGTGWTGPAAGFLALAAAALLAGRGRGPAALALAAGLAALAVLALGLGAAAAGHLAGRPPAARASLASGAWIAAAAIGLLAVEAARALGIRAAGLAVAALALLGTVLALRAGLLDGVSLVVEGRARAGTLRAALGEHLALSAGALALGGGASVPLALLRLRGGAGARLIDAVLNGVQVVPALALFAALVSLLSGLLALLPSLRGLGLAAIGPTPAILGTAAYLALPLVRSLAEGLASPDPEVIETARALGLRPVQILARVRLPLGAPILLGGLRVAAVQAIGLTTLGGLVGAGGLGAVVFDGMAQFAPDLILLGAAPVVALSLAADRALAALRPARGASA
ncbi:binding-protein-dependent transport systems inner membrane component [Methylobacterium sp. 4-46]|uniref:ABC transporter permease subunit n=1 Tax=unclassified Methylobacterium TaxID=2615210 RepID=UPI000152CB7A|nr:MULTISPECIES: ABC transporter permease subunit [Methylobacterium]ACA14605.1 binding-protein-dependent transport systems inner membrane component [Methylobacterium sp. 4-46]WFT80361.1 ABC transporter permease subunit [Methylobacterium nodulans]